MPTHCTVRSNVLTLRELEASSPVSYWVGWGMRLGVRVYFFFGTGGPLGRKEGGGILDLSKGVSVPAGS